MDMVIVGSIGYDDIQTPAEMGLTSWWCGSLFRTCSLFSSSNQDEQPTKVGLVGVVGDDFAVYDQMILEKAGLNLAGVVRAEGETFDGLVSTKAPWNP